MRDRRFSCAPWAMVALPLLSTPAAAQPSSPAQIQVTAPAGGGQGSLSVALTKDATGVSVRACLKGTCSAPDYRVVALTPPPPATADLTKARLSVLNLGQGRKIVRVELTDAGNAWEALVAAPLNNAAEPMVLWSGRVPDLQAGEADAGGRVEVAEGDGGSVKVLVGEARRDLHLCGRPTLLSPRLVDPTDLTLKPVKMQRLSREERARAEQLVAARSPSPPAALSRLLVATGASSAIGSPAALTDGDLDTTWSESRGGDGRGEFVVFRAPSEVSLVAFSVVIRPKKRVIEGGTSPKKLWLATEDRLLEVTLPEDGWSEAGVSYQVQPKAPLRTSCVALVLEEAYASKDPKKAAVTLTEVTALSEFDGQTDLAGLVGALAGGGDRARAAAALLVRGGEAAQRAVVAGYDGLDEQGRHLALGIIDTAACAASSQFFAARLAAAHKEEREHARDRIRRCGRGSVAALTGVLASGTEEQRWAAAEELAALDPAATIERLGPTLASADSKRRALLRTLLARATGQPRGTQALAKLLDNPSLPPVVALDVLRSGSAHLEAVGLPAVAAFARLSRGTLDVRSRYLLCEPASRLARRGDTRAVGFLYERILRDPEPMVRARAAEVALGIEGLQASLATALEDDNVRVRTAAAAALAGSGAGQRYLVRRLRVDAWPLVRARAADSLASSSPSAESDSTLTWALFNDASPAVRARVAFALGARGVRSAASMLRDRVEDPQEDVNVRVKATLALGRICDPSSVPLLTTLAQRAADPYARESANEIGVAAIAALGRLHPADLGTRLDPVVADKRTPRHVRAAAKAALRETDVCKP